MPAYEFDETLVIDGYHAGSHWQVKQTMSRQIRRVNMNLHALFRWQKRVWLQ